MSKIEEIKKIRDATGVGLTEAKQALMEHGDFQQALKAMQTKGLQKASKRAGRLAQAGIVYSYVHEGRIGVLLEVNCETDFVAKTSEFQSLVKDLALQIAASDPQALSLEDLRLDEASLEQAFQEQALAEEVPQARLAEVVAARLQKHKAEASLLSQSFNKEPQLTVAEIIQNVCAKLGENIVISRFSRFELGGSDSFVQNKV